MTQICGRRMSDCLNFQNINVQYRLDADAERKMQTLFAHVRQKFYTSKQRNPSCDVGKAKNGPPSVVFKLFLSLLFFALNKSRAHFRSEHGYRARERHHHYQKKVCREICRPWQVRNRESAH